MKPDMCYTVKGRRVRWGEKEKGNWRKKKFPVNLLFTCCLRTGCLGREVGWLAVTRRGHRFDSEASFPLKCLQEGRRFLTSKRLFVC